MVEGLRDVAKQRGLQVALYLECEFGSRDFASIAARVKARRLPRRDEVMPGLNSAKVDIAIRLIGRSVAPAACSSSLSGAVATRDGTNQGLDFYGRRLGFRLTDEMTLGRLLPEMGAKMEDDRIFFMTDNTDHHSFLLAHRSLGAMFGDDAASKEITLSQITWQVGTLEAVVHDPDGHTIELYYGIEQIGSYQQLRDAVAWFGKQGAKFIELPAELQPGIDYAAYLQDPEGHCLELHYYMEQVGWDGKPRPAAQRRKIQKPWPATLEPMSDTYVDQVFQGPLG